MCVMGLSSSGMEEVERSTDGAQNQSRNHCMVTLEVIL